MSQVTMIWLVAGAALIVAELTTGTFYLLLFGAAAWAGALAAFLDYGMHVQLGVAGVVAAVGLAVLIPYNVRRRSGVAPQGALDVGNDVRVEQIIDAHRLKVAYRGATWDAVLAPGSSAASVGSPCVIKAVQGNVLVVACAQNTTEAV